MLELVLRFLLVGAIAFGGGQAALPLIERIAVAETGWLTPEDFGVGVGLAYATPGPVLILAAFVGQRVAGIPGALAATVAVFFVPVLLSIAAATLVGRLSSSARFGGFQRCAGAAAVGLLGVTLFSLGRPVASMHPLLLIPGLAVFVAERKGMSPMLLVAICAFVGAVVSVAH
jgi:chromate transporter